VQGRVIFVHPDGTHEEVFVEIGTSIMQAAIANDIEGIVAECGGNAMCATCHVYVEESDLPRTPPMSSDEDEMLEFTVTPREPKSRLSCQLVMTPEMDGIVVYLPEAQR
jgi:ferredoxin, 2Fe-2S